MEHYRKLPTSKEILELSDEQIDIMFAYYLTKPEDENIKKAYLELVKQEEKITNFPVDDFKGMGYTDEEIEQIKKDMLIG
ncbi:MAG: hypothetical protein WC516_06550 [Patescibacteria group bacterium]|jgi:hypothetical protein